MSARTWDFTLNNHKPEEVDRLNNWGKEVKRIVVGEEAGKNKTKHLQGRITFKRTYSLKALKKLLPRAHWEKTKCKQDSLYCMKEKIIIDVDNRQQGKRNDLADIVKKIKEGYSYKQLIEEYPSQCVRYKRQLQELIAEYKKKTLKISYTDFIIRPIQDWNKTHVIIGPPGSGKTSYAKYCLPNALMVSQTDDLLNYDTDRYDGIIFDDMSFKLWDRTKQIHLVDNEEERSIKCRYKNASIPVGTKKIITCNEMTLLISDDAIKRRVKLHRNLQFYNSKMSEDVER